MTHATINPKHAASGPSVGRSETNTPRFEARLAAKTVPRAGRTRWRLMAALVTAAVLPLAGCVDDAAKPWAMRKVVDDYTFPSRDAEGKRIPEGLTVPAWELDMGRQSYVHYCQACHGLNGDGKGPSSYGLRPPPRDFRDAVFKFGAVRSGEKPNDDDLMRIVKGGLHGTPMLEWDIPDQQLWRIVQFIKTFPRAKCDPTKKGQQEACKAELEQFPDGKPNPWLDTYTAGKKKGQPKPTGEPIVITEDPWAGKVDAALKKGEEVYHLKAQCANCHPSYLTRQDYSDLAMKVEGKPKTQFRDAMYESIVLAGKDNPYRVNLVPPDFTLSPLRSIRTGHEEQDLYRLIASGVGGVMPAWIDGLSQEELWALVHYVASLRDLAAPANRAKLVELRNKLANQPSGPVKADSDGDGVMDADDACPKVKGDANADPALNGCKQVVQITKEHIVINDKVEFDTGKATIKEASLALLDGLAKIIKDHPELKKLEIAGHTDNQGNAAANKALSQKRAEAVVAALVTRGIDKARLLAKGYGDAKPMVDNDSAENRAKNRRVEINILERDDAPDGDEASDANAPAAPAPAAPAPAPAPPAPAAPAPAPAPRAPAPAAPAPRAPAPAAPAPAAPAPVAPGDDPY